MEEKEITEGNRLIAEFVGLEHGVRVESWEAEAYAEYHSSWDWLMPVFVRAKKKIAEAGWGTPQEKDAKARLAAALNEVYNINIGAAHYCLVKFIQWYNLQSLTT